MNAKQESFQVRLPGEFMPFLYQLKDGGTTDEKVVLTLALGMYLSGQVTLAKAAELSHMDIWSFTEVLKSQGIAWGEYNEESHKRDELTLSKLTGKQ